MPLQEDQQHQAEEGDEGPMQQQDPGSEEDDGSIGRESAAALVRDKIPFIGKLSKITWSEEGPTRPKADAQEVQRTGGGWVW